MSFDLHFPTAILHETILNSKEINQQILPRIEEIRNTIPCGGSSWIGQPFNTCGTFDISKDSAFEPLIKEIRAMVHLYASRLGVDITRNKFVCSEAWLNIYKQRDFQEFHHHAGHHFSAVYYVKVPEGSSGLVFETPLAPDMKPLPIKLFSHITDQRARYTAIEGNCIIFRSNLKHCVPAHQTDEERISLAFNFD